MATPRDGDRDRELLIPVGSKTLGLEDGASLSSSSPTISSPSSSSLLSHPPTGIEAFSMVIHSWASKNFMTGCVILFPIAITFYTTWWFIHFMDGFFLPIYTHLGIDVFGLGFITSIIFIFLVGVFMSSWLGTALLSLGEWLIKKMPFMQLIYAASKQISVAISPDQSTGAFNEVVIMRHPLVGEYAIGFITSTVSLNRSTGDEELSCVYVPTNHLYLGDIFLIGSRDIIRPNLYVREAIGKDQNSSHASLFSSPGDLLLFFSVAEVVISGGMSIPKILSTMEMRTALRHHVRALKGPTLASAQDNFF